jgi:hypothetical protein
MYVDPELALSHRGVEVLQYPLSFLGFDLAR